MKKILLTISFILFSLNIFAAEYELVLHHFYAPEPSVTKVLVPWAEEVKKLLELDLHESLPVMRAHGVPEIKKYLANESSLDECISKGQQITRNYVKRQHTWWNSSNLEIFQKFDKFPSEIDLNSIKID